ncbi:hypothetical protein TNCV_5042301 [Trichonephila clavipes]|nr:hypothetical protein TNCV_5042301 [Trichonephila clavipes]
MNLLSRKELLISEKESLPTWTCGLSQKFSSSWEPYTSLFFPYTRAFGDGPRNFEPWSSDVDDPWTGTPSPNYHTNGWTFHLSTDLTCIAALHGESLVVMGSNSRDKASHDPIPIPLGYRGHWKR